MPTRQFARPGQTRNTHTDYQPQIILISWNSVGQASHLYYLKMFGQINTRTSYTTRKILIVWNNHSSTLEQTVKQEWDYRESFQVYKRIIIWKIETLHIFELLIKSGRCLPRTWIWQIVSVTFVACLRQQSLDSSALIGSGPDTWPAPAFWLVEIVKAVLSCTISHSLYVVVG